MLIKGVQIKAFGGNVPKCLSRVGRGWRCDLGSIIKGSEEGALCLEERGRNGEDMERSLKGRAEVTTT